MAATVSIELNAYAVARCGNPSANPTNREMETMSDE